MSQLPDSKGYFGKFGGRFVSEVLMPCVLELEQAWNKAKADKTFQATLADILKQYVGRPSPLYYAQSFSKRVGSKVYFKREDLNHTGAHKINNCIGQVLLAKKMGKTRIIAETGAGQHGVATATAAAKFGIKCVVYMGHKDTLRQKPNVERMRLLGADIRSVKSGSATLKDALNEALRDWASNVENTFYVIGSVAGPHPYPELVRTLQAVIGKEARAQFLELEGKLPTRLVACVGGGSNAMGLFYEFLNDKSVEMVGVEAAGKGLRSGQHSATLNKGKAGILHGSLSYLLQTPEGQVSEAHSISAGLDYPGVGPEHSYYKSIGRIRYVAVDDTQALKGFMAATRMEGILPALESSHSLGWLLQQAANNQKGTKPQKGGLAGTTIVNMSGRGDKDLQTVLSTLKASKTKRSTKRK